jgi:thiosulfate dehydrogenase [quinone] large subunit
MSVPLPRPGGAEDDARRLGWALFPVRLFLGVTFVYGGIQKLSDPGFLHAGAPTYIGTQLRGFAHGTPGGFVLRAFAIPHPALAGVGVALTEIAVGLLVATGLVTRAAATVGLLLNLLLFLTNSWRTYPYFLGSDIVFVFAWVPFVVAGAARQPTLESIVRRFSMPRAPAQRRGPGAAASTAPPRAAPAGEPGLTRRGAMTAALSGVAALTALIAGISVLLRGAYRPAHTLSASASPRSSATPHSTQPTSGHRSTAGHNSTTIPRSSGAGTSSGLPAGAVRLGPASQLPVGQGATYRDPGNGQPDIVIRQANGTLVAHSAVCTHAGCEVGYQGGQIVCPCHGSVFDAKTGAVITGPAVTGLPPRKVIQRAGQIYALPA